MSYQTNTINRFIYSFPQNVKFNSGDKVALQSISLYNSIFNVEAIRGNNTFSIIWNANTTVQYNFTIPDGNYSVSALNYFLQQQCILNNLYVTNANGDYIYFFEILTNSNRYACQLNSFVLPTSATASTLGYVKPSGATWDWPVSAKTPQIIIGSVFGSLIGFDAQTYPASVQATNQQKISDKTPQIAVVNSLILSCNLIQSKYSNPVNVFYSIPIKVGFGSLIDISNSSPMYNDITAGYYNSITIEILDQSFNRAVIHDTEVVITLSILNKE